MEPFEVFAIFLVGDHDLFYNGGNIGAMVAPRMRLHMAVREREVPAVIMPVTGIGSPKVWNASEGPRVAENENAVVNGSFVFVSKHPSLARPRIQELGISSKVVDVGDHYVGRRVGAQQVGVEPHLN